jgi:hypothetical protein
MGKKIGSGKRVQNTSTTAPINWPKSLIQLTPSPKCILTTVVPNQIYTIPEFIPSNVCNNLITWFETLPLETTEQPPKKDYAARVNDRGSVQDSAIAEVLWKQLRLVLSGENKMINYRLETELEENEFEHSEFQYCIGLNENIRIYRYRKGQYFGAHFDESVKTAKGTTQWTLLIYLTGTATGEVSGGETIFYREGSKHQVVISPTKGMALLHKHGDDCMLHEGALVQEGLKWVLRSDLVW